MRNRMIALVVLCFFIFVIIKGIGILITGFRNEDVKTRLQETMALYGKRIPPITSAAEQFPELGIEEAYLTVNPYSRPGTALPQVKNIVIHYTANPGTTAINNRNYFENLKDSGDTYASSHFVIGLDGEIIQCIPLNEICYASNDRNVDSISIELCHPDDTGAFNNATYNSAVYLVAKLCDYYNIDTDHVIRHYDVTGKVCPKYFVEHEDRWQVFLNFVDEYRETD